MLEQFLISPNGYELFIRLIVAALLGLLIGTERKIAHPEQAAGMRTFALIALSAALFAVIGEQVGMSVPPFSPIAVANVLATVISGIGFIGAGLIFLKHDHVNGLTTAAGLWVTAGIGMAAGLGFYILATFTTVLAIVILGIVSSVENRLIPESEKDIKKR